MNIGKNIRILRERQGLSQSDLAKQLGVTDRAVSTWETEIRTPRMGVIEQLCSMFNISKDDLIDGDLSDRNFLLDSSQDDIFPLVQYAGPVAAHFDATPTELHDFVPIPSEWLSHRKPEDFFIASVDGNSMYPHYQHGDQILCLRCSDMEYSGRVGIMVFGDGEATLKRIEYKPGEDWIDLVPFNPEYTTKRIEGADLEQCRVVGRVVKVFRDVDEI